MMTFPIDNAIFFEVFQRWLLAAYDAKEPRLSPAPAASAPAAPPANLVGEPFVHVDRRISASLAAWCLTACRAFSFRKPMIYKLLPSFAFQKPSL